MSHGQGALRVAPFARGRMLSLLSPLSGFCVAILLGLRGAAFAPDAGQYRLLALGQRTAVPTPFSARVLGPALAGWLGRIPGVGVDQGFLILGVLSLIALLVLITCLLQASMRSCNLAGQIPAAFFAAIFLMPFWVDIFHDYYLPDLLHATILAGILLCLFYGRTTLAFMLLLPAYLARESTLLVALCLVFACWRRVRVRSAAIGVLAVVSAGLISRHLASGGPLSPHGLGGGSYMLGKLFWSFFKNGLGLPLWSNTLQECDPVWVAALPQGLHLGAIQRVGMCRPDSYGPGRLLLAWFGIFGLGPAFAAILWKRIFSNGTTSLWKASSENVPDRLGAGQVIAFRFCIVYGLISILLTPLLGASVDRLVAYGWPFYFVVLPWFICRKFALPPSRWGAVLLLHLITCWVAWSQFQRYVPGHMAMGLTVLGFNVAGYFLIRSGSPTKVGDLFPL